MKELIDSFQAKTQKQANIESISDMKVGISNLRIF